MRWNRCNHNRNKLHNKYNALESPWNNSPSHPWSVFHKTGPWWLKGWGLLFYRHGIERVKNCGNIRWLKAILLGEEEQLGDFLQIVRCLPIRKSSVGFSSLTPKPVSFDIMKYFFLETSFLFQWCLPWFPFCISGSVFSKALQAPISLADILGSVAQSAAQDPFPFHRRKNGGIESSEACPRSLKQQEARPWLNLMCDSDVSAL